MIIRTIDFLRSVYFVVGYMFCCPLPLVSVSCVVVVVVMFSSIIGSVVAGVYGIGGCVVHVA